MLLIAGITGLRYVVITGFTTNKSSQNGGWLTIETGAACLDSDHDGLPNAWENRYGFDPNNSSDNFQDHDGDGYTNIEEYFNGTTPKEDMPKNTPPDPPTGFKFAPL